MCTSPSQPMKIRLRYPEIPRFHLPPIHVQIDPAVLAQTLKPQISLTSYEKPSSKFNRARAPASVMPRMIPITTITASTSKVSWRASGHVGHDTLRNSPVVSRKNDWIGLDFFLSFSATMSSFVLFTAKTPPYLHSGVTFYRPGRT